MRVSVTPSDRAHFRAVARDNRRVEAHHLDEIMKETPGERIETALRISDACLAGRPSPGREPLRSVPARWQEVSTRRGG